MRAVLGTWWARGISALTSTIDARIPPTSPEEKTLYLTFDDGPTDDGTTALLHVLDRFSIPATFFLVGENALRLPHLVTQIDRAGHAFGNHSYSHVDAWKATRRTVIADFVRGGRVLHELLGSPVRLLRPPFGRVTPAIAQWAIRKRQRLTLWDVMPPDFQPGITLQRVSRTLLGGVRNGSIVCMHDNATSANVTPHVLAECLPKLIDRGWKFALLPTPHVDDAVSVVLESGSEIGN